jgi:hypothetical protein
MINLLPSKEKYMLELDRTKSLVIILCSIVLVSLICLVLILLSVKFSVLSEVSYQKSVLEQASQQYRFADSEKLKESIKKYNEIMPEVLSFYQKEVYFSEAVAVISEISRPEGVYFASASLDGQKYEGEIEVNISGVSSTRDNLILFKKNIESQNGIRNVSFSSESWINPTNIKFKLTFVIAKNGN